MEIQASGSAYKCKALFPPSTQRVLLTRVSIERGVFRCGGGTGFGSGMLWFSKERPDCVGVGRRTLSSIGLSGAHIVPQSHTCPSGNRLSHVGTVSDCVDCSVKGEGTVSPGVSWFLFYSEREQLGEIPSGRAEAASFCFSACFLLAAQFPMHPELMPSAIHKTQCSVGRGDGRGCRLKVPPQQDV